MASMTKSKVLEELDMPDVLEVLEKEDAVNLQFETTASSPSYDPMSI